MRPNAFTAIGTLILALGAAACDRREEPPPAPAAATTSSPPSQSQSEPSGDTVKALVGRLDLDKYKATIKGLTAFGDRRQGTDRCEHRSSEAI